MTTTIVQATELKPGDHVVYWQGTGSFVVESVTESERRGYLTVEHAGGRINLSQYARLHIKK